MHDYSYYSGAQYCGKLIQHVGGPFRTESEVREFQKFSCATSPEGYVPVVIELETKKDEAGKSVFVRETVIQ